MEQTSRLLSGMGTSISLSLSQTTGSTWYSTRPVAKGGTALRLTLLSSTRRIIPIKSCIKPQAELTALIPRTATYITTI